MKASDLFTPIVADERLDPRFKLLASKRGHAPGVSMMREVFASMTDIDGNFVEQFQTAALDARTWELYLHAYFSRSGFTTTARAARPDFILSRASTDFCVEAVTSNRTDGVGPPDPTDLEALRASAGDVSALREPQVLKLAGALNAKLRKKYWELEHVRDRPLVFAIEPFHNATALAFADSLLSTYLFGVDAVAERDSEGRMQYSTKPILEHSHGSKRIPSGFFRLPDAENVSGVLFSNAATSSKFNRMGHQGPYPEPRVLMAHAGNCYDHDPNAFTPAEFSYVVGEREPLETWGEGLTLFHNPNARYPLPEEVFEGICQQWLVDGRLAAHMPPFHPYRSLTSIHVGWVPLPSPIFDLLPIAQNPVARSFLDELWGLHDVATHQAGIILRDRSDGSFVWMLLGRDGSGTFTLSKMETSVPSVDAAKQQLLDALGVHKIT